MTNSTQTTTTQITDAEVAARMVSLIPQATTTEALDQLVDWFKMVAGYRKSDTLAATANTPSSTLMVIVAVLNQRREIAIATRLGL